MIKPMCVLLSESKTDGDVLFMTSKAPFTHFFYIGNECKNVTITNTFVINRLEKETPLFIKFLWFFHIVVLRKSHVHLVGVLRK